MKNRRETAILTINTGNLIFGLYLFIGVMVFLLIASVGYHFGVKDTEKKYTTHEMRGFVTNENTIRTIDGNEWKYDTTLDNGTEVIVKFSTQITDVHKLVPIEDK